MPLLQSDSAVEAIRIRCQISQITVACCHHCRILHPRFQCCQSRVRNPMLAPLNPLPRIPLMRTPMPPIPIQMPPDPLPSNSLQTIFPPSKSMLPIPSPMLLILNLLNWMTLNLLPPNLAILLLPAATRYAAHQRHAPQNLMVPLWATVRPIQPQKTRQAL